MGLAGTAGGAGRAALRHVSSSCTVRGVERRKAPAVIYFSSIGTFLDERADTDVPEA
jgi:hypothetical protein